MWLGGGAQRPMADKYSTAAPTRFWRGGTRPGGVEGQRGQQGPLEAPPGQRGPESGCATYTWEAEDGLCCSGGTLSSAEKPGGPV